MVDEHKTDENELSDAELVLQSQKGDLSAFDQLVRRYYSKIYGLVYNMTGNREDAEDVVQDVFVKAYSKLGSFRGKSRFYTWIYRIALNSTINFRKKRTRRQAMRLDDLNPDVKEDLAFMRLFSGETPLRKVKLNELQKKLNDAIQTLSDKHKQAVILHDIQGMPHEEIAKIMKCSVGTVRSRLFYARKKLQEKLTEFAP
ncbi:RNA polymerase sigma factor [Verrucomicrobiota bacterium]